jgi:hypothetical protein
MGVGGCVNCKLWTHDVARGHVMAWGHIFFSNTPFVLERAERTLFMYITTKQKLKENENKELFFPKKTRN